MRFLYLLLLSPSSKVVVLRSPLLHGRACLFAHNSQRALVSPRVLRQKVADCLLEGEIGDSLRSPACRAAFEAEPSLWKLRVHGARAGAGQGLGRGWAGAGKRAVCGEGRVWEQKE